jgi:hypothetical protein
MRTIVLIISYDRLARSAVLPQQTRWNFIQPIIDLQLDKNTSMQ